MRNIKRFTIPHPNRSGLRLPSRLKLFAQIARIALFCLLAATTSPTAAQDETGDLVLIGSAFTGRPYPVGGDVVLESGGVFDAVRDYADPDQPAWIGWHDHTFTGYWRGFLSDGALGVAFRDGSQAGTPAGFDVVDLTDLAQPAVVGGTEGLAAVSGWLRGATLITDLGQLLAVWDLGDPTTPTATAYLTLGAHDGARWLCGTEGALFAVDGPGSVRVFDIQAPLTPIDLGPATLDTDRIDAMTTAHGRLYVLQGPPAEGSPVELAAYDVTVPTAPQLLARQPLTTDLDARATHVATSGEVLLAATDDGRLHAFDLTDPDKPAPGWTETPPAGEPAIDHLAAAATRFFVNRGDQLLIYPLTANTAGPGEPVHRRVPPRIGRVLGDGPVQVGQLRESTGVIAPVYLDNPHSPRVGDTFDTGLPGQLEMHGDLGAIMGNQLTIQMLDLADPANPQKLGRLDVLSAALLEAALGQDVLVIEIFLLRNETVQMGVIDVSDPARPQAVAWLPAESASAPLTIQDGLLMGRRGAEVWFYDVSTPADPQVLGDIRLGAYVVDAVMQGDHAYVLTDDFALTVVDVGDPRQPAVAGSLPPGSLTGFLGVKANRLYSLGFHRGQLVDVANPAEPLLVEDFYSFVGDGGGFSLTFDGRTLLATGLLMTMRDDGLILPVPPAPAPGPAWLLPAYPNPFNGGTTIAFETATEMQLTVTIYDMRGRRVVELARGTYGPGPHAVPWDGSAPHGRAASGHYVVRLAGRVFSTTGRLTLVR